MIPSKFNYKKNITFFEVKLVGMDLKLVSLSMVIF